MGGALVFFRFKKGSARFRYEIIDEPIGVALSKLPQKGFGGDLSNVIFRGKNVVREGNKLIIIKGDNSKWAWSRAKAREDAIEEIEDIRRYFAIRG